MLAYIKGIIEDIEEDAVIIEQNGIGYRIFTSAMNLHQLTTQTGIVKMHLHMNVREDDISLYGFLSKDELQLYELLISVSGIGPKAALAILSALSANDLRLAIISGDVKALTKANGVGTKGAQRVIMELKDKIDLDSMLASGAEGTMKPQMESPDSGTAATNAALALTALGYSQMEATQAVRSIENASSMTEEQLLKLALKALI
jgi:Holliday junction DNA helicase RuvA